jgi:hypothetical protein
LLLSLLLLTAYPDVLLFGETFVFRDFGIFGYPLAAYHRESFWQGEIPLWNPLNGCGIPFLAQWNTMVLYPGSLIYLLLPLPWSLNLFCLAHLFLAGMGMYFLAHRWSENRLAASFAGIVFASNGLLLNSLMWPNNIAAFGWMPWVVWAVERAWQKGGRPMLVAAIIGALQMLAGAPEIILFTWLMILAVWTVNLLEGEACRLRQLGRLAGVLALISALAAAQLLPFLDLLLHSDRNAGFGPGSWSMPVWGWLNLFVPLFRCYQSPPGVFFNYDQDWTSSY